MNVDTGSFRALSAKAGRVEEYHRREALLIRTLAAELSRGTDGPLSSDDIVRYLADAVLEQNEQIRDLRASLGIPANVARERHLHLVK